MRNGGSHDPAAAWLRCMRAQDFAGAWAISDAVLASRDRARRDDPALPYHLRWVWDGTPPDGLRVLVRCYHGLGDTLQFARFLPLLRTRAAHVTLEAQAELCPLLAQLPGVDRLVAFEPTAPLLADDCNVEIMELGHMLRTDGTAIAGAVPYFEAPAAAVRGAGGAIGLCWQAGGWDRERSIGVAPLVAACALPGRRLVSLQRGPAAAEATDPAFLNPRDADTGILATAGLIGACARVVTIDTMIAHLAGALGSRVVLLLKADADWRWPQSGQPCSWYPGTRVLQQRSAGDWGSVLAALPALLPCPTSADG